MDREVLREKVRAALTERLESSTASAKPARPADVVSWRRFDDPRDAAPKALVTEADVMRARASGKPLQAPRGAIVTPLARETAGRLGVKIEDVTAEPAAAAPATAQPSAAPSPAVAAPGGRRTVALAADHGGFALKEVLKPFVAGLGFDVVDLGTKDLTPVDYPDFAHQAAAAVTAGRAAFAIVVDGVGVGSAMAVNRHRGARAAPCSTTLQAQSAREHNDANVLTLGGRHLGEDVAKAITKTFLETPFAGGRHLPRVQKIEAGA